MKISNGATAVSLIKKTHVHADEDVDVDVNAYAEMDADVDADACTHTHTVKSNWPLFSCIFWFSLFLFFSYMHSPLAPNHNSS